MTDTRQLESQSAVAESSWMAIRWWRLRYWVENHLPAAALKDIHHDDLVTGYCLIIRQSAYFTRLTINGRDFFFRRRDGVFDGSGAGGCLGASCHGRHFEVVSQTEVGR